MNSLNILNEYLKEKNYFELESTIEKDLKCDQKLTTDDEENNFLAVSLKAEQTAASLDEYRQKLIYLQRLDPLVCSKYFRSLKAANADFHDLECHDMPLRYLFGVLFENFKLIWDPIVAIIQAYANHFKMEQFWNIFGKYFAYLSDVIGN